MIFVSTSRDAPIEWLIIPRLYYTMIIIRVKYFFKIIVVYVYRLFSFCLPEESILIIVTFSPVYKFKCVTVEVTTGDDVTFVVKEKSSGLKVSAGYVWSGGYGCSQYGRAGFFG